MRNKLKLDSNKLPKNIIKDNIELFLIEDFKTKKINQLSLYIKSSIFRLESQEVLSFKRFYFENFNKAYFLLSCQYEYNFLQEKGHVPIINDFIKKIKILEEKIYQEIKSSLIMTIAYDVNKTIHLLDSLNHKNIDLEVKYYEDSARIAEKHKTFQRLINIRSKSKSENFLFYNKEFKNFIESDFISLSEDIKFFKEKVAKKKFTNTKKVLEIEKQHDIN